MTYQLAEKIIRESSGPGECHGAGSSTSIKYHKCWDKFWGNWGDISRGVF